MMDFLKDEGGQIKVDTSILHLIAVASLGSIAIGSLILNQIEICKSTTLILGGFISGTAIAGSTSSSNDSA